MANKETRVLKSNTFEEFRQKSNEVSLHLGDNEQLNVSLKDKTFDFANVSAGSTLFRGQDDNTKTVSLEIKPEETLDNTGGYIILTGSPSVSGFDAGITLTQSGGYSATIVSSSTSKILVKNSSGTFNTSEDLTAGTDTISASNVQRIIAEAYPVGVVRVYVNGTEINQNLDAGGFHVANNSGSIVLSNNPTVTDFTEGSTIYQGSTLASATFSGTVLSATSTLLLLKNHTGSFNAGTQIKLDGSSSTIAGANHGDLSTTDIASGHVIELNTPASANDDIKIFSMNLVEAVNELQDDVGITENLTTQAGNIVDAINEIEAVFDASTKEITAGSNAFNVTSGSFTIDSSDDIILDADGSDVVLKDAGTQYGSLTNSSGNIVVKSGSTTMLTGNGADATFASDVSVMQDVGINRNLDVDGVTTLDETTIDGNLDLNGSVDVSTNATVHGNLDVDGATTLDGTTIDGNLDLNGNVDVSGTSDLHGAVEMNSTLGVDGNFRVGSDKFNVTASSGNTQIDGTLEVDGATGIDGNFRVGADKFNIAALSGNTQIDGTLNVDGSTTLNGTTIDGDLDLNGNADISINLTVGGVLDIGTLNSKFTNTNNVKLALNELHDELGNAVITGTGTPAAGQSNITNAVNAIDAEIGSTGYIGSTITFALDAAQDYIGTYSNTVTSTISGALNQLHTEVGSLSLDTTATDLTAAVNELHGEINSNDTDIGNLMTLIDGASTVDSSISFTGLAGTNIKSAIQELASEKLDLNTGGTTGALARINAGTDSIQSIVSRLNLSGNVVFQNGGTNANKMTFNTGTTLDLSNATLLLPGAASSVNIFGVGFLKVDGNTEDPMGFSVDRDHVTQTDTSTVSLQWNENYTDGTTASNPARGWQLVGLNDSGVTNTADVVTFYNAKELIDDTNGSGINVVWDAQNQNFDLDAEDFTITLGTGPISGSVSINNLQSATFNTTLDNNSVTLGTHTTGAYVRRILGTSNEIEVSANDVENASVTIGLPNSVDIVDLDVTGTTNSTSSTTGALTVAGGLGVAEDVYIGGDLVVQGDTVTLNTETLTVEDTLVLAGNGLSSEPSTGGFGLEVGPITNPSGVASNVTGAHSIVYNYANDRWEADGSLILSEATLGSPSIESIDFTSSRNLDFINGAGITVATALSGTDIDVTVTNTDRGSSQFIYKNISADSGGTATANVNDDTLTISGGTALSSTRSGDTITLNHDNYITAQTFGQSGTEDGQYIKSVTVNAQGHVTGVTSDNFDNRYDDYSSWTIMEGNGTETSTVGSGQTLHIEQGSGIEVELTATRQLTITNTDRGSSQFIYKNVASDDGTATANVNNDTLTIAGGSSLATARSGDTITINHDVTGASSINNSNGTVIQDLTINTNGHVTGHASVDLDTRYYRENEFTSTNTGSAPVIRDGSGNFSAGTITATLSGTATNANNVDIDQKNDNVNYQVVFVTADSSGHSKPYIDTDNDHLIYNPSTHTLTAGTFSGALSGNATSATSIYLTAQNGDNNAYNQNFPVPYMNGGGSGNRHASEDDTFVFNPHTNTLSASTFSGSFTGNGSNITNIDGAAIDDGSIAEAKLGSLSASKIGSGIFAVARIPNLSADKINSGTFATGRIPTNISITGSAGSATGNAGSATVLATGRNFSITGDITANAINFDGSSGVELNASIDDNVVGNDQLTDMAANTIKGRKTDAGSPQDLSAGDVRGILGLNAVATSGAYSDLSGTPSLATVATSGAYSDLSGTPTIPSVGNGTVTINQAGVQIATFTMNQSGNTTVNLTDNNTDTNTTYSAGTGLDLSGTTFSVESDLTNEVYKIGRTGSGYVQIDASTQNGVDFYNTASGYSVKARITSGGVIHAADDIIAFSSSMTSDVKLKENIERVEGALDKVSQLDGVTFTWKKNGKASAGVIAQNVEEVLPSAVKEVEELDGKEINKHVDYNQLSALFIEAIKELTEENKQIRAELENLKNINS